MLVDLPPGGGVPNALRFSRRQPQKSTACLVQRTRAITLRYCVSVFVPVTGPLGRTLCAAGAKRVREADLIVGARGKWVPILYREGGNPDRPRKRYTGSADWLIDGIKRDGHELPYGSYRSVIEFYSRGRKFDDTKGF